MFIFLDVDGVLNNLYSLRRGEDLDLGLLQNLKFLVNRIKPSIILSSTWRLSSAHKAKLRQAFIASGIPLWIGQTQDLPNKERREEINEFILERNIDKCIIIDDDSSAFPKDHIVPTLEVRTDFRGGLTFEKVVDLFSRLEV